MNSGAYFQSITSDILHMVMRFWKNQYFVSDMYLCRKENVANDLKCVRSEVNSECQTPRDCNTNIAANIQPIEYFIIFIDKLFSMYPCHGFPWWLRGKEFASNVGDPVLISGSGPSPGEGCGNPLQYS